ncbi:PH domain-containing protein [Croceicoccus hydrothermalis]|uniref:PH domain-containing protein n=1 Tax=Croceicoccus hydrothermalis TaxID=2867964 RepID=UPI001EFAA2C3|nr:PH domain-containing protein [Croceicoccus hydrothermalis]
MMNEDTLDPVHPNMIKVMRMRAIMVIVPVAVAAIVAEIAAPMPTGAFIAPVALLLLGFVVMMPRRRYRRLGYRLTRDRLRVVRGWWNRRDTVVPFGRVQHIDVNAEAIERLFGLATLVVHTAGTHNASVALPGLEHGEALAMRETIRAFIAEGEAG